MTSQMRLDTRFLKNPPPLERYRGITEGNGQFSLNFVNEVKGTETGYDSTSKSCVIPFNCFV